MELSQGRRRLPVIGTDRAAAQGQSDNRRRDCRHCRAMSAFLTHRQGHQDPARAAATGSDCGIAAPRGRRPHAPARIATEVIEPNRMAESATIANKVARLAPNRATATQPMKAATIMRAVPDRTGQSTCFAPWLAK